MDNRSIFELTGVDRGGDRRFAPKTGPEWGFDFPIIIWLRLLTEGKAQIFQSQEIQDRWQKRIAVVQELAKRCEKKSTSPIFSKQELRYPVDYTTRPGYQKFFNLLQSWSPEKGIERDIDALSGVREELLTDLRQIFGQEKEELIEYLFAEGDGSSIWTALLVIDFAARWKSGNIYYRRRLLQEIIKGRYLMNFEFLFSQFPLIGVFLDSHNRLEETDIEKYCWFLPQDTYPVSILRKMMKLPLASQTFRSFLANRISAPEIYPYDSWAYSSPFFEMLKLVLSREYGTKWLSSYYVTEAYSIVEYKFWANLYASWRQKALEVVRLLSSEENADLVLVSAPDNVGKSTYFLPELMKQLIIYGSDVRVTREFFLLIEKLVLLEQTQIANEIKGIELITSRPTVKKLIEEIAFLCGKKPVFNPTMSVLIIDGNLSLRLLDKKTIILVLQALKKEGIKLVIIDSGHSASSRLQNFEDWQDLARQIQTTDIGQFRVSKVEAEPEDYIISTERIEQWLTLEKITDPDLRSVFLNCSGFRTTGFLGELHKDCLFSPEVLEESWKNSLADFLDFLLREDKLLLMVKKILGDQRKT